MYISFIIIILLTLISISCSTGLVNSFNGYLFEQSHPAPNSDW